LRRYPGSHRAGTPPGVKRLIFIPACDSSEPDIIPETGNNQPIYRKFMGGFQIVTD
jgi:hypothetical protein